MWMMVMFDLPVGTSKERKGACDFREGLKTLGFVMAQFSVYLKHTSGQSECDTLVARVQRLLPEGGRVYIHCLSDKQYEKIVRFEHRRTQVALKNPEQYELF